ncbi:MULTISPECIES: GNAT family N-acetyltransferase [Spirulina sp. CCY15215]|uniref:GNAT family N-acetyltransferase n=1 Tax=Spirulina sp. CCY15215 TaxID=2767591 RepID=UPI00194FE66C
MAESKILETERLQLIPFSQQYCTPRYVDWLNDPIVMRYSEQRHVNHSLESCQNYYRSFIGTPHYFWAIVSRDRELGHIGNANAYIDTHNKIADIGIMIGEKNLWGQGYGLEVWKILCSYLLDRLKLRKVTAGAIASNIPMLSLMKKAGMVEEGRRLRHYLWEEQEVDIVYMALFNG